MLILLVILKEQSPFDIHFLHILKIPLTRSWMQKKTHGKPCVFSEKISTLRPRFYGNHVKSTGCPNSTGFA